MITTKNNKIYWNKFYKKKNIQKPSNFAKFVSKNFFKCKKLSILDLGCGDGRDSFYFAKNNNNKIVSVDSSLIVTQNSNAHKKKYGIQNIDFICLKAESSNLSTYGNFDVIYSRFFLHSISRNAQDKVFKNLIKVTKINSIICLEFRTLKDELYLKGKIVGKDERITDHYRRFIDLHEFINLDFIKKNFCILYKIERKNIAKFRNENPIVARIVLKRL